MPVPRQYIIRGGGLIEATAANLVIYSKEDIIVDFNTKTGEIMNTSMGKIDEDIEDYDARIKFTPDAQVTNALLAYLFPYFQSQYYPGQSILGLNADVAFNIYTRDGWKYSFPNTGVTKQPALMAGGGKNPFGAMEVRAIRPNNSAWTANVVNVTQAAYPGDAGYNRANNLIVPFVGVWTPAAVPNGNISADTDANPDVVTTAAAHGLVVGDRVTIAGVVGDGALNGTFYVATVPSATTFTLNQLTGAAVAGAGTYTSGGTFTRANGFDASFPIESGWTLDSQVTLNDGKECETDDSGLIDITFQKISVTAKCTPVGPTPQEVIALSGIQGAGAVRYGSLQAIGRNLYLTGTGLYAKLTLAALKSQTPIRASSKEKRVGELTWTATEVITGGVPQPLAQISTNVIA